MKRNKRLILKTARRIEKIPQSYDQGTFRRASDEVPCGMTGCIGGEIIICSAPSVQEGIKKLNMAMGKSTRYGGSTDSKHWPGYLAARLAGFTDEEATKLFYNTDAHGWPTKFRDQFQRAKSNKGEAQAAVRLLRYLADGGEV